VHDKSSGYDDVAGEFARRRNSHVGVAQVRQWAASLPPGAIVLDLGCGLGVPISEAVMAEGCHVYGIDASPRLVASFRARFPDTPVACEAVEESAFFQRRFDGVVSWGLMFLLPVDTQALVIGKVSQALVPGGSFLFTSPRQECTWTDILTGRPSVSPGVDAYRRMLAENGLTLVRELDDEGENYYYVAEKSTLGAGSDVVARFTWGRT
jgi:2-polyprenyl-3-methyl-5-hydroxy-6-metoxy-1,4-benzoquinol methylase